MVLERRTSIDKKTKQIKAVITAREAQRLERLRKRYLFKSDYEFVGACVSVCLNALDDGGLDGGIKGLPDELRTWFGDVLYGTMLDARGQVESGGLFAEVKTEGVPPKAWVDRFVSKYYEPLFAEFANRGDEARASDGFTAVDIFQDTIFRLYTKATQCESYEAWEREALDKFKSSTSIQLNPKPKL